MQHIHPTFEELFLNNVIFPFQRIKISVPVQYVYDLFVLNPSKNIAASFHNKLH